MKDIWIINDYAGAPDYGMELRHYNLGRELVKLGSKITIISSAYSHLFVKYPLRSKEQIDDINYLWVQTLHYGNARNRKRVLKWFIFSFKIFFLPFKLSKPDVIVVSPMAPFSIFPAWILAKIYSARLIYEVKDIWPLTLVEIGGFSFNNPLIKLMSWSERFALKRSDVVVSNLQNYDEYMKHRIGECNKFEWISNGVNLKDVKFGELLSEEILNKIPKHKFIVGYFGSLGPSNAIDYYLKAIRLINKSKNIVFLFAGNGELKDEIEQLSKVDDRVIFLGMVNKKTAFKLMEISDVLFKGNLSKDIYKYGMSPIKLFEYLLSGTPVVHSTNVKNDLVKISNSGVSVNAEDSDAIAHAILKVEGMTEDERNALGKNGKKYVKHHFSYEELAKKFNKIIQ